ncbi:MAG: leucine-rich repeat protein [Clostridia bacterium]|nr:leucine-rich repeat protein [Clostridia bacterium]
MKNTKIKIKQGFTLTELLVVIAILAILATVSIVGYNVFIDQAHQSIALQEMTQIRDALFNQDVINGDDYNLADGISEADYLQNGAMGYFWSEALAVEEFVATLGMNGIFKVENGFCYYSPAGKNATAKLNVVTGEITTTSGALQGPHYPPNHVHRYQTVTTAPTCTLVGYTTNTCNACNYSFVNNYVSALGHAMDGDFCSVCGKGVSQGLLFEDIDENSYAVVGRGNCEDIDVVIPSTYNGKPVVSIGARAFENDNLQNVTIPNSVTSIYDRAFTGCSNLQSITIPNSVTYLDYGVFDGCLALITVALPNGIESIPVSTFVDCSNLQYVTIPNSVTSIGNTAFSNCTKLQSITMPQGVTTIESRAFWGCESLQTVTIPSSLDIIFSNAFYGCSQLQNIYISDLSAWCNISNISELMRFGSNDKKLYLNNQLVTELIIPNDVTTIQHDAFINCKSIISVTLPEELESIENYFLDGAFSGCERLVEVYNKSKHLTVKKGNYSNGSVGAYALSVTNFGEQFTSKLTNDNGFVVHTDGEQKVLVAYFGSKTNVVVPSYVTQINQFAFYNCQGIKSITIPNSVTSIGNSAFYGCSDLVSITIPNSVTSIGLFAFKDCTNLSSVVLGDQITSIYSDAFEGCENLQYNVKDDLKYLGNERNPYLFLFGTTTKDITTAQLD